MTTGIDCQKQKETDPLIIVIVAYLYCNIAVLMIQVDNFKPTVYLKGYWTDTHTVLYRAMFVMYS